jgi:hypothetical protein
LTGLFVSSPVGRKSEPLNSNASYAEKLGPFDEVSQGHSVLEVKTNCTKHFINWLQFLIISMFSSGLLMKLLKHQALF